MDDLTMTGPKLVQPSAADIKEFGVLKGYCVFCQEPVLEDFV